MQGGSSLKVEIVDSVYRYVDKGCQLDINTTNFRCGHGSTRELKGLRGPDDDEGS